LRKLFSSLLLLLTLSAWPLNLCAQDAGQSSREQIADQDFKAGNELMAQHKPAEALLRFQEALAIEPNDTSVLFNGGLAAYLSNNFATAADLWKRLKALDPEDWRARSKLMQVYQALGKTMERDAERAELFALWKSGKNADLSTQSTYCREQFEVNGIKVMAFERFEFKGDRPVRYVFNRVDVEGKAEDHWYSLGSYEDTNRVWRERTKPKEDVRLFHLDEYFTNGHATYMMMEGEPSYDETRAMVVKILEGKAKPASSSTWGPSAEPQAKKPKN
jgi:tetratricopeptide (TPR) repeat protein